MAKVIDITEKLTFDDNPRLRVKDQELEVRTDAMTVLKIMQAMSGENQMAAIYECFHLLFSEEDMKKVEDLRLSMDDFMTLVSTAMDIATGNDEENGVGEAPTRTTT
ncbi:MAG: hypothetical protein ACI4PQ_00690 [Butyricicoccaceae bacterium]